MWFLWSTKPVRYIRNALHQFAKPKISSICLPPSSFLPSVSYRRFATPIAAAAAAAKAALSVPLDLPPSLLVRPSVLFSRPFFRSSDLRLLEQFFLPPSHSVAAFLPVAVWPWRKGKAGVSRPTPKRCLIQTEPLPFHTVPYPIEGSWHASRITEQNQCHTVI